MFVSLEKNILANSIKNVECHQLAVGSMSGQATLSRSLIHGGDNRLGPGHSEQISTKRQVRVTTLDEVTGGKKIDFIKMDVQGWEWEAIRGMEATLQRNPAIGIHFEFWPAGLRRSGCEPLELLRFLSRQGFQIHRPDSGDETLVQDFSLLLGELSKEQFVNLYAQRNLGGS
jgi:FkbM family methyltransferase